MGLLEQLDWHDDYFQLAGFTFRLQHQSAENTAADAFLFYKTRSQIEQFDRFLGEVGLRPRRVLELGIWDGGSAAFWTETLQLERYAAVDLQTRGDSAYFQRWKSERATSGVSTHWGVDQTDGPHLECIIADNALDPLDLILDDCSHLPAPTLRSFELLFSHLRVGGYYVIEDWAWALQPDFQRRDHPWGVHPPLHPVVTRLVELHGSRPDLVASVKIYPDFVAVEKGPATTDGRLDLRTITARRPRPWAQVAVHEAKAAVRRARRVRAPR